MHNLRLFIKNLLDDTSRPTLDISRPQNFEHRIHSSYCKDKGFFEGLPPQWRTLIEGSIEPNPRRQAIVSEESDNNDTESILRFVQEFFETSTKFTESASKNSTPAAAQETSSHLYTTEHTATGNSATNGCYFVSALQQTPNCSHIPRTDTLYSIGDSSHPEPKSEPQHNRPSDYLLLSRHHQQLNASLFEEHTQYSNTSNISLLTIFTYII